MKSAHAIGAMKNDIPQRDDFRPPGPPGVPILGNLLQARKDPLKFTLELMLKYGPIASFRIGHFRGYGLFHPDYFHHVLSVNNRNYDKQNYNYDLLRPVLGEGLVTSDGDHWLKHRRLIQPLFRSERIRRLTSDVAKITAEVIDEWDDLADREAPVELVDEMMKITLRVITSSLFSLDDEGLQEAVRKPFDELNKEISERFINTFILPLWVPTPRNLAFKSARNKLNRVVYEIISRRRKSGGNDHDLLGVLMGARNEEEGDGLSDQEIRDEVMTMMLAGHETTANLLSWTCYLLSQNPGEEQKLIDELNIVLGDRTPEGRDLSSLTYMKCVLQESLRLFPPVWIISRRAVEADRIGGYEVPAGLTVTMSSYALHRHPEYWDQPEVFKPERFDPENGGVRAHRAYYPFGGGPRACIGSQLAMIEAQMVLAMIYRRYRLRLVPGHIVEPEPLVTLTPKYGLKMTVKRRSPNSN